MKNKEYFHSYKILPDHHLILTNYEGKVSIAQYIQSIGIVMQHPEFVSGMQMLVDLRGCMAISFINELSDLSSYFKKSVKLEHPVKIGILISTPNHRVLMTAFKPIVKMNNMIIETYYNFQDAMDYLDYSMDVADEIQSHLLSIKR